MLSGQRPHLSASFLSSQHLTEPVHSRSWVNICWVNDSMNKQSPWTMGLSTSLFVWVARKFRVGFVCSSHVCLVAQTVKNLPAMRETQVQFLGQEDPLEKGIATYSSILAWRIPRTEEAGRLQSMGSQWVRNNWATDTFLFSLSNVCIFTLASLLTQFYVSTFSFLYLSHLLTKSVLLYFMNLCKLS